MEESSHNSRCTALANFMRIDDSDTNIVDIQGFCEVEEIVGDCKACKSATYNNYFLRGPVLAH